MELHAAGHKKEKWSQSSNFHIQMKKKKETHSY